MADGVFRPDPLLQKKMVWTVLLVFLLGCCPFLLLGLIPELGLTYAIWFLVGNAVWVVLALLLIPPYYRSVSYELRDLDLVERKGIITRSENLVPYRMITNIRVRRGPLDRILGLGTLQVHTAGYSQSTEAEASLVGLNDYQQRREELLARVRQVEGSALSAPDQEERAIDLLREIRDALREQNRAN